jgi:cellobiose-specific phosphotransferase system component IIB
LLYQITNTFDIYVLVHQPQQKHEFVVLQETHEQLKRVLAHFDAVLVSPEIAGNFRVEDVTWIDY